MCFIVFDCKKAGAGQLWTTSRQAVGTDGHGYASSANARLPAAAALGGSP